MLVLTDSYITSPAFPVIWTLPFPLLIEDSINKSFPPTSVHAIPVAIPGLSILSLTSSIS